MPGPRAASPLSFSPTSEKAFTADPFQLFEMHADIASLLGLDKGCWVMLELSGQSPTVIFEDPDLAQLKQKSISELESAALTLHHQLDNLTAFTLLTRQ